MSVVELLDEAIAKLDAILAAKPGPSAAGGCLVQFCSFESLLFALPSPESRYFVMSQMQQP